MTDEKHQIEVPPSLTVKQLAELFEVSPIELIKQLMRNGVMANINQAVDYDTAAIVAANFGYETKEKLASEVAPAIGKPREVIGEQGVAVLRPPVITVMGHVDHGKTSLLDAIRQTNVTATEVGSITQHIGAYQVEIDGKGITFLDTPGHEAFTAIRARGAQITDIAVLVVAADDGMMPQTIEAINHARAASVPIVVAINKIDKANANAERVKQQLAEQGLLIEEWGGDVVCTLVSAKKKEGISELLENILIVAEMLELKANPYSPAQGVVIEAGLDKTKGSLATVLVQSGTLKIGDPVIVGTTWGKVKAMFNDKGKRIKKAEPAIPVGVLGLRGIPQAGDTLTVVATEPEAHALALKHQQEKEALAKPARAPTLDALFAQIEEGAVKALNIVLKTDVQGSIEPIRNSLERLGTEQVKVNIIHFATGSIIEGDVLLALASKGIIIGFNTRPEPGAKRLAELEGVDIRCYEVIYHLVEEVEKAIKGMLEPTYVEVIEGHAEVRAVFPLGRKGKVAGVYVNDGRVSRNAQVRILRQGQIIHESTISSLKRFKEDAKEVATGFECGIGIEGFTEFQIGDIIELYSKERQS